MNGRPKRPACPNKEKNQVPLPTEKTARSASLSAFTTLIYGKPKIGKSTFAASFPNALFLDTEGGLQSLSVHRVPIHNWKDLLTACGELAAGS